jgi:hypothetical protein
MIDNPFRITKESRISFNRAGIMSLTLQAIKYMMWLQLLVIGLGIFLYFVARKSEGLYSTASALLYLAVLYLFLRGLRQGYVWVAILFAILCVFNIKLSVTGGLSITGILGFIDAVLSFVAICGIVIWFRERRELAKSGEGVE